MSDLKSYEQVICTADLEKLEAQRDALLAAAKEVDRLYSNPVADKSGYMLQANHADCGPMINTLRQAIAACEE